MAAGNRKFLFVNADDELEQEQDSVSSSSGSGDSGKLATLDVNGVWDESLIPDSVKNERDWKDSVRCATETNITLSAPGATLDGLTMANGEFFLAAGQTAGEENGIYEFTGAATPATRRTDADVSAEVTPGMSVPVEEGTRADSYALLTTNGPVVLDTTSLTFSFMNVTNLTSGDGITIATNTVSVDLKDADSGLEFVVAELAIDFADPATEMATVRAVKASDLSTNGANQGAKILGGDPTSISQSAQTTIQGILEDMSSAIDSAGSDGIDYTSGTGGISQGDLCYISSNDTCLPIPITGAASSNYAVGVAATTEVAAATVQLLKNDTVITGVISGLSPTAGDSIYWSGTALTLTKPAGAAAKRWRVGFAKNASDLHVEVISGNRNQAA